MTEMREGGDFGQTLRELREARKWSAEQVARLVVEQIGGTLSGSAVGQWEANENKPRPPKVAALEVIFEQPAGSLSRLLGYLPPEAQPVTTIEDAIRADKSLTRDERNALQTMLAAFRGGHARQRRAEHRSSPDDRRS